MEQTGTRPGATLFGWDTTLPGWVVIPVFLLIWALLTYVFAKLTQRISRRLMALTGRKIFDLVFRAFIVPLVWLFVLLGIKIAADSSTFSAEVRQYAYFTITTLLTFVLIFAALRVLTALLLDFATNRASFRPILAPILFIVRLAVVLVGAILWLQSVGVPVGSLLTALGIGGLAVGLALNDTLSNLFAGMYLVVDRHMRVGDLVRLDSGLQGFVTSIDWRSTKLVTLENNLVIVPNRRLADSVVVNYSLPQANSVASVDVAVAGNADARDVEAVLLDEARAAAHELPGMLPEQTPIVRLHEMTAKRLVWRVVVGIKSELDVPTTQSDLRKRFLLRLRKEKVPLAD